MLPGTEPGQLIRLASSSAVGGLRMVRPARQAIHGEFIQQITRAPGLARLSEMVDSGQVTPTPSAKALAHWKTLFSDPDTVFDRTIRVDLRALTSRVTRGTNPAQSVTFDHPVPAPGDFDKADERIAAEKALAYQHLKPSVKMNELSVDYVFIGSCTKGRKVTAGQLCWAASAIPGKSNKEAALEKFTSLAALAAFMDRPNIGTDLMVPKQFLTRIEQAGFGAALFNNIRYHDDGSPNQNFILNQPRFQGAEILVALENFGCGSSREHAPWALLDYGFKVLISPKFADIFKSNCGKNGMVLIELDKPVVDDLIARIMARPGYRLSVNLEKQSLAGDNGFAAKFDCDPFRKAMLFNGWDDICLTLKLDDDIKAYENSHVITPAIKKVDPRFQQSPKSLDFSGRELTSKVAGLIMPGTAAL